MTVRIPSYISDRKTYDSKNDILKPESTEEQRNEYERLHNDYDWYLFYRELHPEMEIPYKQWNGEIIDVCINLDGGQGSGNFGHAGRPGKVGGSAPEPGNSTETEPVSQPEKPTITPVKKANTVISEITANKDLTKSQKVSYLGKVLGVLNRNSTVSLQKNGIPVKYKKRDDGAWDFLFYGKNDDGKEMWLKNGYVESDAVGHEFLDEKNKAAISKVAQPGDAKQGKNAGQQPSPVKNLWTQDKKKPLTDVGRKNIGLDEIKKLPDDMKIYDASTGKVYTRGFLSGELIDSDGNTCDASSLKEPQIEGDFFDVEIRAKTGIAENHVKGFHDTLQALPKKMQGKYEDAMRGCAFERAAKSSFSPNSGTVQLREKTDETTMWHELSHAVDKQAISKTYPDGTTIKGASAMMEYELTPEMRDQDMKAMLDVIPFKRDEAGEMADRSTLSSDTLPEAIFEEWYLDNLTSPGKDGGIKRKHNARIVSDVVSGMTNDAIQGTSNHGGHEKRYWEKPVAALEASSQQKEYWAEYCQLRIENNTEMLGLMQKMTPNRYALAERIYEEAFT